MRGAVWPMPQATCREQEVNRRILTPFHKRTNGAGSQARLCAKGGDPQQAGGRRSASIAFVNPWLSLLRGQARVWIA
jgi:hypothetical protein